MRKRKFINNISANISSLPMVVNKIILDYFINPKYEISPFEDELFALGFIKSFHDEYYDEAVYLKVIDNLNVAIKFKTCININRIIVNASLKSKKSVEKNIMDAVNNYNRESVNSPYENELFELGFVKFKHDESSGKDYDKFIYSNVIDNCEVVIKCRTAIHINKLFVEHLRSKRVQSAITKAIKLYKKSYKIY
jgi:hypothetical protein